MDQFHHDEGLVFDVGMNHGADAAFYAAKGFRVLSIEANPASVEIAQDRYKDLFDSGKLQVLNVALAEQEGVLTFYVCNEESGKSTTSQKLVRQLEHVGFSFTTIEVPCRNIRDILVEWGVPHYMKIDIEGCDFELVRQLGDIGAKPLNISIEAGIYRFDALLEKLSEMGYSEFQLISQRGVPAQREPGTGGKALQYRRSSPSGIRDCSGRTCPRPGSTAPRFVNRSRRSGPSTASCED